MFKGEVEMGKIILVTGGSRGGKSKYAENLLKDKDEVLYIATAIVTDSEMEDRIKTHRERRNQKWKTYEGYKDLHKVIEGYEEKDIMLDCVTIMMTNLMFEENKDFDNMTKEDIDNLFVKIQQQVEALILKVRELNKNLVLVTNEVGYGLVPEYKLGRIYRDIAGSINQYIGSLSDEVYLVACGFPLKLK